MKILALTRYSGLGASSRLRMMQYLPSLRAAGASVRVQALLDDDYLRAKYAGGRTAWTRLAQAYFRRVTTLAWQARDVDLLWIEKELAPWLPLWLERALMRTPPVVLDFDDAIFHKYDLHRSAAVRRLYGRKIDRLMQRADLVVAGNDYLAQRARYAGAAHVEILPTVVDLQRYSVSVAVTDSTRPVRIGWIGSPSTVHYLDLLAEPLERLASRHAIELRCIGAAPRLQGIPVVPLTWREDTEVASIAACDIGIMPLTDSPWERGKCGYKLIQYMACGLPVVASPVGVNRQIVEEGVNGLLAADGRQWEEALERLVQDASLREQYGSAGRRAVEERYNLQVTARRLVLWLQQISGTQEYSGVVRHFPDSQ